MIASRPQQNVTAHEAPSDSGADDVGASLELREQLANAEFRKLGGFPLADDCVIQNLSDPPYFTICPNPFIGRLIDDFRAKDDSGKKSPPQSEPFAADVSEGKDDTIYMAHSYHTKVPYKAVLRHILHYTNPGDVVLDGFAGSGMTGVAATLCSQADAETRQAIERDMPDVKWGPRLAILNDLSPAAALIQYGYNSKVDVAAFEVSTQEMLKRVESACGHLYRTTPEGRVRKTGPTLIDVPVAQEGARISFTVWSEVFNCPDCLMEICFYDHALEKSAQGLEVRSDFACPGCGAELTKRALQPCLESVFDPLLKQAIKRRKRVPVAINYILGSQRAEKRPDPDDLKLIDSVDLARATVDLPVVEFTNGSSSQGNRKMGMTHLHHYFTNRNFLTLATMLAEAKGPWRRHLMLLVQSVSTRLCSMLTTYQLGKRGNVPMTGTLYVGSLVAEANPLKALEGKLRDFLSVFGSLQQQNVISCGSSTDLRTVPSESVDYVFVDPPFGDNLNYAQLNFVWEGWLRAFTHVACEAIVDEATDRPLRAYQGLLRACMAEFHRALKPGRWMTVVFHNSKSAVWNAIQEAIWQSGFVIADVRTLDKKQGTPKQVNYSNSVKQDLIISAYKPEAATERKVRLAAGNPDAMWQFVRDHLAKLPVLVAKDQRAETLAERQGFLLFDRMVAFHVQRGISVPMSAGAFYAGLAERFVERDGMFFLPTQVAEYDRRRMTVRELDQLVLIPRDEFTAIQWIRQQLREKPRSFQELHPEFTRMTGGWSKHEKSLDLKEVLEENFLRYDRGEVPGPIHAYLSSNFKDLRGLPKNDARLQEKAKDRWYVPDPNREGDLEKLRERALLAEFEEYKASKQRSLKVFRTEAVRAGFKAAYDRQDYKIIVEVARKLPENVLREDEKLLMYYDVATMRLGDEDSDHLLQGER